jgi:carboxypeptidase family protein/TonB-dependent receptor-like protein
MRAAFVFLIAALAPVAARAQQPATPPAPGQLSSIVGFAFDSIRGNPLIGATIRVASTRDTTLRREGKSGQDGAYRVDSIPAGDFTIELLHPLLDSLGLSIGTRPITFPIPPNSRLDLVTPSEDRYVASLCPAARRAMGPAVLAGRVLDADTEQPATGTKVSVAWFETTIQTTGIRRVPRVREATVGEDGTYRICGLPADLDGALQAQRGSIRTTEIKVTMDGHNLAVVGLRIGSEATVVVADSQPGAASPTGQTGPKRQATAVQGPLVRGNAVVSGKVVNAAGGPVKGARVDVIGAQGATLTRDDGTFSLGGLPSGTQTLVVRQIGFAPVEVPVALSTRAPQTVAVTMREPAHVLETVEVKAERDVGLDRVGFSQRKKSGQGYFMTTEELDKRNPLLLSDVFRTVPGLRVGQQGSDHFVESTRGTNSCVTYYLDGSPWQSMFPGDIDRLIPPNEVGAVEVFGPTSAPAQFQQPGQGSCTTIVMWTKTRLKSNPRQ